MNVSARTSPGKLPELGCGLWGLRLPLGLAVSVLLGAAFAAWVSLRVGREVVAVERHLAAPALAPHVLGIQARGLALEMSAALLAARLARDPVAERVRFQARAEALGELIANGKSTPANASVHTHAAELEQVYRSCLTNAAVFFEERSPTLRREAIEESQSRIERMMAPLLRAGEELDTALGIAGEASRQLAVARLGELRRGQNWAVMLMAIVALAGACVIFLFARRWPLNSDPASPRLERQEKLASLGTLAAGVAHEIRNPLTAIKFRLFSLNQSLPAEWSNHEDVQVIGSEINRLERIVKGLLEFARPDQPVLGEMCARRLLEEVQHLLEPELHPRRIRLVLDAATPLPLRADRQQLQQVLINLVQNAADSIGRDGTITLRAGQGASRLGGRSRDAVVIEVADTGKGIPAEVQRRLFDPFFSTKDGGTGLGLAIAARIVENHGGLIQYQSQPNRGTVFQVVLPGGEGHASEDSPH